MKPLLTGLFLACGGAGLVRAQPGPTAGQAVPPADSAGATGASEVITSVNAFHEQPDGFRTQPQHVRFEFVVRYFDPEWDLLWAESEGKMSFVPRGIRNLSLKAGQHIRVDGMMSAAEVLSFEQVKVSVLPDSEPVTEAPPLQAIESVTDKEPHMAVLEGYFNRQTDVGPGHLMFEMTVGNQLVYARILSPGVNPDLQLENAFVQARGVLVPNLDQADNVSGWALWIARPQDVKVLGRLQTDPQFNLPATPIEALPQVAAATQVRVEGTVRSQNPGRSLTLRDGTGQVEVLTGQTFPLATGERVEAIGYSLARKEGRPFDIVILDLTVPGGM